LLGFSAPNTFLTHFALGMDSSAPVTERELASAEAIAELFKKVAKSAAHGVVQISVAGDPEELAEFRRIAERVIENRQDRPLTEERWQRIIRDNPRGTASGILMDDSGFILTNNHVVGNKTGIFVRLDDHRTFEAHVVGTDPQTDIAVIKIDAPGLRPLPFGDSGKMQVGDWVLAVGAPLGLSQTVTHGILSAKGRSDIMGDQIFFQDFFQTDAAINRGNSGGPLVNLRGEVIGMNTAVALNDDGGNAGIAFAIPSNVALRIANQLKRTGQVARGWLGVRLADIDTELVELFSLDSDNGVMVDVIYADSPGQRAGLQVEDIITHVGDEAVTSMRRLQGLIGLVEPGVDVDFTVLRDGQPLKLSVNLGRRPENVEQYSRQSSLIPGRSVPRLPFLLRSLSEGLPATLASSLESRELALQARELVDQGGVLVVAPADDRADPRIDLHPGELIRAVNGKRTLTVTQLLEALAKVKRADIEVVSADGARRTIQVTQ
jgi:serine protease Do